MITVNKYDKYKDSGIEWIGEIPQDWNIKRLKVLANIQTGNTPPKEQATNTYYSDEGFLWVKPDNLSEFNLIVDTKEKLNEDGWEVARVVPPFTPLVCCIGTIGKFGLSSQSVAFNQQINAVIFNEKMLSRFGLYFISCQEEQHWFYANGNVVQILNSQNQGQLAFPCPSIQIQQQIADYLDKKCGEIDRIVETQKSIIEKLKEYKQSVITEAVTKGLDKSAPLKDSGIEYLGYIPAHWALKRLRYIATCQNGISKSGDFFGKGSPFVSYGDVYNNSVLPEMVQNLCEVSDAEKENYSVKANDIFFTRTSETIEEIAITCICKKTIENATFAGFLIRVRPYADDIVVDFSKYYFACDIHRKFFVKEMNLVTRASLSQELLKKLPVLLPPKEEQQEIADYLDKKCSEIDSAISDKEQLIKKLTEYKKSLIYECVTGKRKVIA